MIHHIALAVAERNATGGLQIDRQHRWHLTPKELAVAEHLFTAPSLLPFVHALNRRAGTLDLSKLRPFGRSSGAPIRATLTTQLMLSVLLSLVTQPDVAPIYEGYDPGVSELASLPQHDLQVVLEAIRMKAHV